MKNLKKNLFFIDFFINFFIFSSKLFVFFNDFVDQLIFYFFSRTHSPLRHSQLCGVPVDDQRLPRILRFVGDPFHLAIADGQSRSTRHCRRPVLQHHRHRRPSSSSHVPRRSQGFAIQIGPILCMFLLSQIDSKIIVPVYSDISSLLLEIHI